MLSDYDFVICTPKILQNALEDGSVKITDLSLIIFDECHHTGDDHPYNMIMTAYLKEKIYREEKDLPQILGLTATPGTGGNDDLQRVVTHLQKLCANLDVTDNQCFVKVQKPEHIKEMQTHISAPKREQIYAGKREEDPFSDRLNEIMRSIETKAAIAGDGIDRDSQQYASFISEKKGEALRRKDSKTWKCCEYLTKYNRGTQQS